MPLLDIHRRTGWLFTAVIVGHVVLISAQVNTKRGVPVLESVTFGTFAELQRAATSAVSGAEDGWRNYIALQQTQRENRDLKDEIGRLQVRLQEERAEASQSAMLQELLQVRSRILVDTTGALVIGAGASPDFRTITIDKGQREGIRQDMAVIAPAGVVGRVVMPTGRASKVQLLIDRNAAAGALVERTRAQGVVVGSGSDVLQLEYVAGSADVKVGDRVVTSGIDGIYPKGFVIGRIVKIDRGTGEAGAIVVEPAVAFSSLEAVLVVTTQGAGGMVGIAPPVAAPAPAAHLPAVPVPPPPVVAPVSPPAIAPASAPTAAPAEAAVAAPPGNRLQ